MAPTTFVILGLGSRGLDTYASYQKRHPDEMKIVAAADIRAERRAKAQEEYDIPTNMLFDDGDKLLEEDKLADAAIIAVQDQDHVRMALKALEKGYHILLEKPISPKKEEILELEAAALNTDRKIAICHVLRYTPFYRAIKNALDEGKIGRLMAIDAIEHVGYWHQAHSFIRGNWRTEKTTSPMLMQKSCHDMDILRWLAGAPAKSVKSFGSLDYFKKENAPAGSTEYCLQGCKAKENCPFDCEKIYITDKKTGFRAHPEGCWPCDVVVTDPTEEKLREALKDGPYGRCVFRCDNTVVDHQNVAILFENGVTANFLMTGFTKDCRRSISLFGTEGEINAYMEKREIILERFDSDEKVIIPVPETTSGHGGGDEQIMHDFIEAINTGASISTSLEESLDSHLMVFEAEEDRLSHLDSNSKDGKSNAWDPDDRIVLEWPGRAQGMCDEQVYW